MQVESAASISLDERGKAYIIQYHLDIVKVVTAIGIIP